MPLKAYSGGMKSRRKFCGVAAAVSFRVRAHAQVSDRVPVKELARHKLTGPQAGLEAILVEVSALPGASSCAHRDPDFVLGYVPAGKMQFAITGEPPRVVKAGGTFFEPSGALHTGGSANPDAAVRSFAFLITPKGSPVTLPVQGL